MQVFFKFSEHGRIAYPIGIYICHKLLRPKLKPPRNSKSGTAIVATVAIIIYKSRATRNPYGRKTLRLQYLWSIVLGKVMEN